MKLKFISKISKANLRYIEKISKTGRIPIIRTRASALLLSSKRYTISQINHITGAERHSISRWIDNWEIKGRNSLIDAKRPGRTPILTLEEKILAKELVDKYPQQLNKVIDIIKDKMNKTISLYTLKRAIKSLGKRWKRMRRSLKKKRNEQEFRKAKKEIQQFKLEAQVGGIQLVYFDGSNFNMLPNIPYAWQDIGRKGTLLLPSERSKSVSVLGFLDIQDNKLESVIIDGALTGDILVSVINNYIKSISEPTILIWDNAPAHTSNIVGNHIDIWADKVLFIYSLPKYSPELNKIEILWREMKYKWLPELMTNSFEQLKKSIEKILITYNTESGYVVNFT